ncbi:MAG: PfkB family carbohydrate kinase, partial [Candidatus Omnitrophota bacterium]
TKYVLRDKEIKTGLAFAKIDKKGNSSYLFYKTHGPQTTFKKTDIPVSAFKKADVFHTGSWYSYSDYSFRDTLTFLKQAKKQNTFTTYDPNWREGRIKNKKVTKKRIRAILPLVDLLKLSGADAMGITGSKTLDSALKKLHRKAVVTLSEKGGFYWDGNKKTRYSALKVRVADTIGAGDAFMAGLIYRYCRLGKDLFWKEMKTNLDFASSFAGLICTEHGATTAVRSPDQVKKFFKVKAGLSSWV